MPASILEYLDEYGDISFEDRPFGDADSLVLAQLSYLKYDDAVHEKPEIYLRDIQADGDGVSIFGERIYGKRNRGLFDRLLKSRRYSDLKISHYVNILDREVQTQFSAVTFLVPGIDPFVAYRGTDESMIGWKEDFNLTYMTQIPAQRLAIEYLTDAASMIDGRFRIGGHSKGGHLSIYAAMHASEEIQDRLTKIYCLDGPGFMKGMLQMDGYERIRDRIVKYLPQSSLIGMLQQRDDNYTVIKSIGIGLLQHNLYTWRVENGELVPEGDLKETARIRDDAINDWIESLAPESRQKFVDSLYEIISGCEADTVAEFMDRFMENSKQIISSYKDTDADTTDMLRRISRKLIDCAKVHFMNELENMLS